MIRVSDYKSYAESLKTRIAGIGRLKVLSSLEQLQKYLSDLSADEIVLVAVIPSADSNAPDSDNIKEANTCLFYVLKKVDKSDYSEDDEINDLQDAQDKMTAIKNLMKADHDLHVAPHFMHDLEVNGMHTDPEPDFFGCNGWSLSFTINNNGF